MAKSPAVILFDSNGVAMAVEDGLSVPVGTQALLAAGSDGAVAHVMLVDASGRPTVVGAGIAGVPDGGVVSIQGVAGGVALPVTGSVSVANASVSANDAPAPASSTQVGGSDGTNLQAARVFDADQGGGAEYVLGASLRRSASGGSVEAGTATDPLRVDPTGTTTQPISAVSLPLPTGAATEATLATRLADSTFTARVNTLGQKAMAGSTPVVLASDQSSIAVGDGGGSLTVDGAVTANIGTTNGLALDATLTGGAARTRITDGVSNAAVKAASTAPVAADPALVVTLSPNTTASISNPSVGANNAVVPASSTQFGGSDGTNLQAVRVFDGDTGAGTQYVLGATLRKSASGGTVEAGTVTDPLRTDPTGTTTQPISAAALPLPAGAATEATLATRLAEATFTARINTQGQKTSAGSTPVVLASDQTPVSIADGGGSITVDTPQLPAALVGSRLDVNNGAWLGSTAPTVGQKTMAASLPVVVSSDQTALPITAASLPLPTGAATEATLATRVAEATFTTRINTQGQKAMAASTPVVLASDQSSIPISDGGGSLTVDGAVTANIGTTNGLALDATLTGGTQRTRITDGTSNAAVKPASTAALATDPALVVAISPNNTITTSNASVGLNNAALPPSSTEIGGSDGTNLQSIRVFDADSGVGTQYVLGATLRKSASGGSVEAGTATDPLRVDPTGTTTQPISAVSLPLPAGAATEATLATRLADATFTARINTLGPKTAANSTPVVMASDQTAIPITDNAGSLTVDTTQLPVALVGGRLDTNLGAWLGSTAPAVGQKTMVASVPVVIASDQTPLPTAAVGTHANAWNAVSTGANGNSTSVDCQYTPYVSVFGTTNGTTTISIQVSQNNTNFYTVDTITISAIGGSDFGGNYMIGARYVRLQSSTSRTATATIAGKA